ncbi:Serine/threonine-protein kinase AfsK [Nonomuraea coxensis DSM 45129]|uniref:Serine/threonine-protein kinase AfsK n=1 Tax=Nonomuraea coxensis DSM 45129 TaxID=1122611 RepID=A0ABX8U581_9ACTN|nr:serine/threonine-protein kinase [Nonomuraea coxensis]QYC42581.1 Serine/threonine-protein kinase AfsK [Nonomuraea coxensis DSM 45129]
MGRSAGTPLKPEDPPAIGSYELVSRLGSGGMGVVYLAKAADGSRVALKAIRRDYTADPVYRARFHEEVSNARKVASFCTARVLDHGEDRGVLYLVTEYIDGISLEDHLIEHGALSPSVLHSAAVGVAAALTAIHAAGLVHRDLKPANVMLTLAGPRVIDFGLARSTHVNARHTNAGMVMGTPGWIAPEQVFEGRTSPAGDVFAWGSLIAYAGLGGHPFGEGDAYVMAARARTAPPDLRGLPAPLDRLVAAAIHPDPSRRPTARQLLLELVGASDEPAAQLAATKHLTNTWNASEFAPLTQAPGPHGPAPHGPGVPGPGAAAPGGQAPGGQGPGAVPPAERTGPGPYGVPLAERTGPAPGMQPPPAERTGPTPGSARGPHVPPQGTPPSQIPQQGSPAQHMPPGGLPHSDGPVPHGVSAPPASSQHPASSPHPGASSHPGASPRPEVSAHPGVSVPPVPPAERSGPVPGMAPPPHASGQGQGGRRGPRPPAPGRAGAPPHPDRTGQVPHPDRTGPVPHVERTGPVTYGERGGQGPRADRTGPVPHVEHTGPMPRVDRTGPVPGGMVPPHQTGQMPLPRHPRAGQGPLPHHATTGQGPLPGYPQPRRKRSVATGCLTALVVAAVLLVLVLAALAWLFRGPEAGADGQVQDGKLRFAVTGTTCPKPAKAATRRTCRVGVQVDNVGPDARVLYPGQQKLVGADDAVHGGVKLLDAAGREITPIRIESGGAFTGTLVFDLPRKSKPVGLEAHDSGLSSGARITFV